MEETFKKIITVEMDEKEAQLWDWIGRRKDKWLKAANVRCGEVKLNIDSGGNVRFTFIVDDL